MTRPDDTQPADRDRDREGPYDAPTNGRCAQGHPVNAMGRCDPLNRELESAASGRITLPGGEA